MALFDGLSSVCLHRRSSARKQPDHKITWLNVDKLRLTVDMLSRYRLRWIPQNEGGSLSLSDNMNYHLLLLAIIIIIIIRIFINFIILVPALL